MANRLKGEASFTVDGETFTLVFDAGAFLEIEDRTGFGFIAMFGQLGAFERDQTKVKLGFLTTLIECGLAAHHPDLDRAEVADMLLQHMPVVTGALEGQQIDTPDDLAGGLKLFRVSLDFSFFHQPEE